MLLHVFTEPLTPEGFGEVPPPQVSAQQDAAVGTKREALATALWNLDRVDQRAPPLDGLYCYGSDSTSGTGAWVWCRNQNAPAFYQQALPYHSVPACLIT